MPRLLFLCLLLCPNSSLAQDTTTVLNTRLFSSSQYINITTATGWVYKPGHDSAWAKPGLNTSGWIKRNPSTFSVQDADQTGRAEGWFRLRLRLDSTFIGMPLWIRKITFSAADLYVDGQLLASYGNTGANGKLYEESGDHNELPTSIDLSSQNDHLIALHLVDYVSPLSPKLLKSELEGTNKGLIRLMGPESYAVRLERIKSYPIYTTMWVSVSSIIAILFWLLSFQDMHEKEIIRLLAIGESFSVLFSIGLFLDFFKLPFVVYIITYRLAWQCSSLALAFWIIAILRILGHHPARLVNYLVISVPIAGAISDLYSGQGIADSIANIVQFLIFFYLLVSSWKRPKGAQWAIVIGAVLAILFASLTIIQNLVYHNSLNLGDLDITGSVLALPLSFLIYVTLRFKEILAEDRAKAAKVLQITEEKKELLATQNQVLEQQVEARTAELNQSLTELQATQAQLIQKEKLASLGELTAGIAHEIQNPLNFVNNFSEVSTELLVEQKEALAKGDTQEAQLIADDLISNLQKINHHGGRASSIVKGMLEHSRTESGEKRLTDLNALAQEYLNIAYHVLKAKDKSRDGGPFHCELVTDFDPTLKSMVVPQEIGRVLLNLYNNAFYAVSERARQTTDSDYKPTVEVHSKRQSDRIVIQVRDNGMGVPESLKGKIFQPFFTTKPTGEGTGLGLSLSYDIITKGHGGTLRVESQAGKGSTFVIELPQL